MLMLVSVGIALLLLEFGIRLFFPQPLNYYNFTFVQAEGAGEMVLGAELYSGKKRMGNGPYRPNLSMQFGGVAVNINSHGWRDSEYSLQKPDGITRIMVVGDSVTFGYGVQLEEMFTKVLEQELNRQGDRRYEVISQGGAGANTYYQRNAIRINAPIYTPDLVILAFNLNDILPKQIFRKAADSSSDIRQSISRAILRLRSTLDETLRSRSHLYFIFRARAKIVLRQFGIVSPTLVRLAAFDIESAYGIAAWQETRTVLLEIASQLRKDRIPFLLAILPLEMQLSEQIADIYRREYGFAFADSLVAGKPQEIIKDFAEQHRIAYVDLLPAFRKRSEEKTFFRIYGGSVDYNHPNPLGHRIIAEEIKSALTHLVLPPNGNGQSGRRSLAKVHHRER